MEAKELLKLIEQSPINMFAVKNVKDMLAKNGYKELNEHQLNNIKKGDKVFFVRNETSLIALNVGKDIKQIDSIMGKFGDKNSLINKYFATPLLRY